MIATATEGACWDNGRFGKLDSVTTPGMGWELGAKPPKCRLTPTVKHSGENQEVNCAKFSNSDNFDSFAAKICEKCL